MSTFSSVVNKSGKKFAPRATARRNVLSRPSSIRPSPSEQSPVTQSVPHSLQDAVNSSNVAQVPSVAEQDAAFSALPGHAPQSADITARLDIIPPRTDSAKNASRTVEHPRLTGEAGKVAMRERWAADQERTHKDRVAKSQSNAQPTAVNDDEINQQRQSLNEASHEHGTNPEEQAPSLEPSTRSTRSRKDGAKRKLDPQAADPDMVPEYRAATDAPEKEASKNDSTPRKRRKVVPKKLRPASVTGVSQSMRAISGEYHTEALATESAAAMEGEDTATAPPRAKRKSRGKKTMQEVAAEIVADAVGDLSEVNGESLEGIKKRKRKWKRKMPEDAEDHEIAPSEVKMVDLVKDKRLGKGSKLEARLEEVDWDEVKKKRKEAAEEAEKQRELEREEKRTGRSSRQDDAPAAPTVPKLTVRDNQIVMEEESRMVDRHAEIDRDADETVNVQEIDDVTRRVNQSTIGRQSGVKQKGHWNDEMTDLFYKGLRMFGTDFMMISKMFPGMSRRHIKLKYTREERTNLTRVHRNLIAKEDVDMEEYSQMSNQVYEDPKIVTKELEAEEQRLRNEDIARRAREAEAERPDFDAEDSNVLQSREQGTAEPAGAGEPETTMLETESSAKENRFASVARSIVQRAAAPKKAKKQNALARKRERKKKTGLEGTEEVVGSIEDVQRE